MSDLLESRLAQGHRVHPVSGAELASLGKRAAVNWANGDVDSLSNAVLEVVKSASASLCPEQVKRVVEFANTEAYLTEFRKEGAHKIVDFGAAGPADPAEVLKELNIGGGTTVMNSGLGDYSRPPEKTASVAESDLILQQVFAVKTAGLDYPEENPYGEVIDMRDKLAAACQHVTAQIDGLEVAYQDLSRELYQQTKQAALNGVSLGEVVQAWSSVNDDPAFVKAAFDQFVPRFASEGVFHTLAEMGDSLFKTAGAKFVNADHPLVDTYRDFCDVLDKLASLRAQHEELRDVYNRSSAFLSEVMRKEAGGVLSLAGKTQKAVAKGAQTILGTGDTASNLIGVAVPTAAVFGAGKMVNDALDDYGVKSVVPGTQAYMQRRMMRHPWIGQQGGMGY